MTDPTLTPWAAPPPPHRNHEAFVHGVRAGLAARRRRARLALVPALAAALAIGVVVVSTEEPAAEAVAAADLELAEPLFALPALDGSTDEELALLDVALDAAIARHTR